MTDHAPETLQAVPNGSAPFDPSNCSVFVLGRKVPRGRIAAKIRNWQVEAFSIVTGQPVSWRKILNPREHSEDLIDYQGKLESERLGRVAQSEIWRLKMRMATQKANGVYCRERPKTPTTQMAGGALIWHVFERE